ncbi:amidohydrolase [Sphaerisporangium krabiense]|uniref:Hippurate hydrolase n=1 Tax=Sphaerisporangium krabiense TaxID=763782 RepID=A0A7W8Z6H5_9ACTN|nr:M20 family metallopeptidase [Sphaerisporangium krabiense]MBB5628234.1 hippurate hydrolase [Sphaerisporangium krabiense]GII66229.1 amidohydrolase [Sphaerisporangium krabiense]
MSLREAAHDIGDELVRLRHALHREPELGLNLPRTQEKVLAALAGLPLTVSTGKGLSSVTAVLRGARPGPAVLLRGDMDALPVTERGGSPVVSEVHGRMHACGHDLHTTMLAGAAHLLAARRDRLAGDVVFMFQPGEEGAGGAKIMIDEGVLDAAGRRPVAAYALHVISSVIPQGTFVSRAGPIMAAADRLLVTVRGAGGHGSTPHRASDPIPAACEMVTALQTMVTRGFDVFDPVVVTVGSFHAGTADNIIPEEARFEATVRSFSAEAHTRVQERILTLLHGIGAAHGLTVDAHYDVSYPVTVNDRGEAAFVGDTVREVFDEHRYVTAPQPFTGAEDFSFVCDQVPSAFVALGACPTGIDPARAAYNHAPEAAFDDAVLADGAALYAELAERRLSREAETG